MMCSKKLLFCSTEGVQLLLRLPQTNRSAEASSMPLELLAMQVYVPASDRWEGLISKLPDSSRVNLGSWTDPLAKTRSPAGKGGSDRWYGRKDGEQKKGGVWGKNKRD